MHILDRILSGETKVLDQSQIKELIPHRDPLLLLDKIENIVLSPEENSIKGFRKYSKEDPIFKGHFPEKPVLPGVYIIEGIAQTAAILNALLQYQKKQKKDFLAFLTSIKNAKFKQPVIPSCTLHYSVKLEKTRGQFFWGYGEAFVDDMKVAETTLSAAIAE
jgi:3-hydroxyacyl-[acyl-carrier-protein] dehydratase